MRNSQAGGGCEAHELSTTQPAHDYLLIERCPTARRHGKSSRSRQREYIGLRTAICQDPDVVASAPRIRTRSCGLWVLGAGSTSSETQRSPHPLARSDSRTSPANQRSLGYAG